MEFLNKTNGEYEQVFTVGAIEFLEKLTERFGDRISELLTSRLKPGLLQGILHSPIVDFLESGRDIREDDSWKVEPPPQDLLDRRVEITGPVDRKMIINALNSGANVFMADFEDSLSPTWDNCIQGQINLKDAVNREIDFTHPETGKEYKLNDKVAVLFVRPRGLHLKEKNISHNGYSIPAAICDFGLYVYHNASNLIENGTGPYFYLPKLEHHNEAALWNDIFMFAEQQLNLPEKCIRATVLLETLPAAFQMEEILYELRDRSVGLNCGRWDYIFSFIKNAPEVMVPDRDQITMTQHFMKSYTDLLIKICHKRGAHAIGGMAAQIPIKNDAEKNKIAMDKVRADKLREVKNGHDGTWVAHPGLVSIAKEIFDANMPSANQIDKQKNVTVTREDLLKSPTGTFTRQGLKKNILVIFQYIDQWLKGNGCVPLNNLMEDAATAEISRAQVWQWLKGRVALEDGTKVTRGLFNDVMTEVIKEVDPSEQVVNLVNRLCAAEIPPEFLTTIAYKYLD